MTSNGESSDDFRAAVREAVLDEQRFASATFSGRRRGQSIEWERVTVRPVMLRGERHLQFAYPSGTAVETKNYAGTERAHQLNRLLAAPFRRIDLHTTEEQIHVRISNKGVARLTRSRAEEGEHAGQRSVDLDHDRTKRRPLPEGRPDALLQAIGVQNADGSVRADRQRKFRQINEFLRLVTESGDLRRIAEAAGDRPLSIVDCGCGQAALSFAAYQYLTHDLDIPTRLTGVDANRTLIERHRSLVEGLGWSEVDFVTSSIIGYRPQQPPDVVFALHACDTATDEALAQAVRWESELIVAVPCCHQDLNAQLARGPTADDGEGGEPSAGREAHRPLLRHGILRERTADILTDAFRALILRMLGYRTEVSQFISPEQTAKNLMIRAVRTARPGDATATAFAREYEELKRMWGVTPYLERLLGEEIAAITTG